MNTKGLHRLLFMTVILMSLLFLFVQPGLAAKELSHPAAVLGWAGNMSPAYGIAQSRLTTDSGAGSTDRYAVCAADTSMYRSAATGIWADDAIWQVSTDGGTSWSAAGCWPTSVNDTIQIQSGHAITVDSNITVDQTTIVSGGQVTVGNGATLTIVDSSVAGADLIVSTGANLTVNGTILNSGGSISSTSATAVFNDGSTYQHNFTTTSGTIPTATWNNGSTVEVVGYTSNSARTGGLSQSFSNFTWNCPSQTGNINFAGYLDTVNGNFTVSSTGTGSIRLTGNTTLALNVGGNLAIESGLLNSTSDASSPTVNVGGNIVLSGGTLDAGNGGTGVATYNVVGNWTNSGGTFTPRAGAVAFNGSSTQTIGGAASTTFNGLTINNVSGVTLDANATVNGLLTFTNGRISAGANTLILGSSGSVTGAGAGKYVYGKFQKPVTAGSTSLTFEVGGASNYAPVAVAFNGVSAGSLTASTTDGQHPAYRDNDISSTDYINRYWTLTPSVGLTFTSYDATFNFVNPGDVAGTPSFGTASFILQKYSGSAWASPHPSANTSSTSTTVTGTGFTSFSDFMAGDGGVPLPVTLSYFVSNRSGEEVDIDWCTATESGNVGFNLYAMEGDQRILLNSELIPSQGADSLSQLDYSYRVGTSAEAFYLEEVDVNGGSNLHGPYRLGQSYGSRVEANKIDWASLHTTHAENQIARQDALSLDRPQMLSLNLRVNHSGLYRVTYEMLREAGLDLAGLPAANLLLTNRGKTIPLYVAGADPFGPGGYIEFNGQALDTIYTDTNVYTLQASPTPVDSLLVEDMAFTRESLGKVAVYTERLEIHNQRAYANYAPGADAWYDTSMLAFTTAKSWEFPFQVDGLANAKETTDLELTVWGVTDWPQSPDHRLLVSVNGLQVSTDIFDGLVERTIKVKLPAGLLHEGANTLKLTLPADTGADWDMINLDKFSVTYPRKLQARDGRLSFTAAGNSFTVTNLPSAEVVVYRLNGKKGMSRLDQVRVRAERDGTFSAAFGGSAQSAKYLVSTVEAMLIPQFEMPRAQADLNHPAEYLIISHPDFIDGLQPLIAAREAQGLTVSVVNVTDLYARYTYGLFDPQAIQQHIAYAVHDLGAQYVLLVGGDTYDYRNYLGVNSISFIPSLYVSTGPIAHFVPADPLYADVDGDHLPDVALGRFPVRSVTELNLMVSKTLAYQGKDYGQTAVFASDLNDGGLSFKDINLALTSQLPAGWSVDNIHLNDVSVDAARTQLIAGMNRGAALVTFTGHSGPQEWTFSNLFNIGNAAALTNHGRPFVVVQWGCWNNYYVDPLHNYLVQSFLFSGDQGAAAVMGASTLTDSSSETLLGEWLTPKLAQRGMPIGQALQLAKRELGQAHPDLLDVLLGWSLMGDPALFIVP